MRYSTELMREILTSEKAQDMIDYVSQIYGNSYVGLWIFQVIGAAMGEVYEIAAKMRYETNPATAELLLDMWEDHYGIARDDSMSAEQRQQRLVAHTIFRRAATPAKIEAAVSAALGGAKTEVTENVEKNTFLVNVREAVPDIRPAMAVIERIKPAHLLYQIRVCTQTILDTDIKIAFAMNTSEKYNVEVNSI